ncbi:TRAP transporter small permease [uncultured Roseovarius sp.]|uniref:TRAP transporter small permease n=1 Tax=uncultured Roseovarius sp. TaxID=293344 RepID=UPI002611B9C2|nr:TRAP transporter small permease subunit [uncultured Roseovarius sp.]
MSILAEVGEIFAAFGGRDSYDISQALRADGAWVVGTMITLFGGALVVWIYKIAPFVERHMERSIMVWSYLAIAAIIFWGVIDRFVFSNQQPWSTTIPPLLFMIMAWFGCSYNVRLRTHLSFSEFRSRMPRAGQMACLMMDAALWLIFCVMIVTTTLRVTANSASNFQIVLGTDDVMQWWFILTVPLAFTMMAARVFQNVLDDLANWRSGEPLIKQAVIGEEPA